MSYQCCHLYHSLIYSYLDFQECDENEYRCTSCQCIQSDQRCDTSEDCLDGSDEENCRMSFQYLILVKRGTIQIITFYGQIFLYHCTWFMSFNVWCPYALNLILP
jgi:hypothetical protein